MLSFLSPRFYQTFVNIYRKKIVSCVSLENPEEIVWQWLNDESKSTREKISKWDFVDFKLLIFLMQCKIPLVEFSISLVNCFNVVRDIQTFLLRFRNEKKNDHRRVLIFTLDKTTRRFAVEWLQIAILSNLFPLIFRLSLSILSSGQKAQNSLLRRKRIINWKKKWEIIFNSQTKWKEFSKFLFPFRFPRDDKLFFSIFHQCHCPVS